MNHQTAIEGGEMRRPGVFLAVDHLLLLEAFYNLLKPRYKVVGTTTDGRQMLTRVRKLKPDVVVLDISMPHFNAFDAVEKLKKMLPDVQLVLLIRNEDPDTVAEAFRIRANGYLLRNSAASGLLQAIDAVISGGNYVTAEIAKA